LWTEWNGKYRDTVRDFWRGEKYTLAEFGSRLTGSSDLYRDDSRRPLASINFITAHDGFTLRDLVSYNEKHNEANGEGGNDGESHNRSWNCGVEGPTDDAAVRKLRAKQQRNFLATLLISQGVPMLAHGDELGRTQSGNNNVYCQDNELAWVDWDLDEEQKDLLEFTGQLVRLRNEHPVFRRRRFFHGDQGVDGLGDLVWFTPDGKEMQDGDWSRDDARAVSVFLNGDAISEPDPRGEPVVDDSFLILLNSNYEPEEFLLPGSEFGEVWTVVVDTVRPTGRAQEVEHAAGSTIRLEDHGMLVLTRPRRTAG
jgi:isoamylase